MNGTGDGRPQTNSHIITIVVVGLVGNATIGVCTLAYCLITEKKLDSTLFIAFVGIVNYILGVVSGMLVKSSPTATSSTPEQKPAGEISVPAQKLETSQ